MERAKQLMDERDEIDRKIEEHEETLKAVGNMHYAAEACIDPLERCGHELSACGRGGLPDRIHRHLCR